MPRNSFTAYRGFQDLIKLLPEEKRLAMHDAVYSYGLDEREPTFDDEQSKHVWEAIKPKLRTNIMRWENGCKGGAPRGNTNAKKEKETLMRIKSGVKSKVSQAEYSLWVDDIYKCEICDYGLSFIVSTARVANTLTEQYMAIFQSVVEGLGIKDKAIEFIARYGNDSSQAHG